MIYKYQFHISYNDKINTASSKAVQDCKSILSDMGYLDFSIDDILLNDSFYRFKLIVRFIKFCLSIKKNAIVAVQYPLTSGNSLFKYFIKAAKIRGVKIFCIVHDLDDLRYPDNANIKESKNANTLNDYDCVIVHNDVMKNWLLQHGLTTKVVILQAFDYLAVIKTNALATRETHELKRIAFAGNLSKSKFVYVLNIIDSWYFNLYGPNYLPEKASIVKNICWQGSLSPDEIVTELQGAFGLIWDGEYIDRLDTTYGGYLKYNYPHKLSLYLAAGLPVLAPRMAAVSTFITYHNIGILIDSLTDLTTLDITPENYSILKNNVLKVSHGIKTGKYFTAAVKAAEAEVLSNQHKVETV